MSCEKAQDMYAYAVTALEITPTRPIQKTFLCKSNAAVDSKHSKHIPDAGIEAHDVWGLWLPVHAMGPSARRQTSSAHITRAEQTQLIANNTKHLPDAGEEAHDVCGGDGRQCMRRGLPRDDKDAMDVVLDEQLQHLQPSALTWQLSSSQDALSMGITRSYS